MFGGFGSQRRADEFEAMLSAEGSRPDAVDPELARLLDLVGSLRSTPEVSPRPEFVADLRTRLVAAAEQQTAARTLDDDTIALLTPAQRRGSRERRFATVLGGFAVVAATGSMAVASQGALPGDVLYPMKRAIENARTNLQPDDAAKATTLLGHAEGRLAEVETLSRRDNADAGEISETLQDFSEQTNQASILALDEYSTTGDDSSLDALRDFTADAMDRLDDLSDLVPAGARPALITAAQTVRQVDAAAMQACPTCGDGGVAELPPFATQSLEEVLRGTEATEAAPRRTPPPADRKGHKGRDRNRNDGSDAPTPGDPPTSPSSPVGDDPTSPLPEGDGGPVGDVTDTVKDRLGLDKNGTEGDDESLTDDLIDDVDGVLGGLLP